MKHFKIYEPTYHTNIILVVDCTHEQFLQYLNKKQNFDVSAEPNNSLGGQTIKGVTDSGSIMFVIWIRYMPNTPYYLGSLMHEVIHVGIKNMEDLGIPISDNVSEPFTYFCEWLFTECCEKLKLKVRIKK